MTPPPWRGTQNSHQVSNGSWNVKQQLCFNVSPEVCIGLWKAIRPCCLFRGYTLRRRWSDKCKTHVNTISAVAVNVDKYNVRQGTRFFIWLDEFKRKYRSMHPSLQKETEPEAAEYSMCFGLEGSLGFCWLLAFALCCVWQGTRWILSMPYNIWFASRLWNPDVPWPKTRRQCLQEALRLEAFFEIHEYRNYQKTIGFLASLFMLSKFWILDKPWYIKVAEGSGYKQMLTKFPACSLLFHIFFQQRLRILYALNTAFEKTCSQGAPQMSLRPAPTESWTALPCRSVSSACAS